MSDGLFNIPVTVHDSIDSPIIGKHYVSTLGHHPTEGGCAGGD